MFAIEHSKYAKVKRFESVLIIDFCNMASKGSRSDAVVVRIKALEFDGPFNLFVFCRNKAFEASLRPISISKGSVFIKEASFILTARSNFERTIVSSADACIRAVDPSAFALNSSRIILTIFADFQARFCRKTTGLDPVSIGKHIITGDAFFVVKIAVMTIKEAAIRSKTIYKSVPFWVTLALNACRIRPVGAKIKFFIWELASFDNISVTKLFLA
mmetsp:Transcript_28089/g.46507  ORF Transcript_28089/g.46507 Transcript_28089/m.46507 type:complete len:216 (+) Transcript_28089:462-1109(+)